MTLMEKLAEAGYAKEDFFHHNSDLYVYATSTTQRVIDEWFKEQNMDRTLFVKPFKDNITGRPMYDVGFQYTPYWEEHCVGVPTREAVQDEISAAVDEFLEVQGDSGASGSTVDSLLADASARSVEAASEEKKHRPLAEVVRDAEMRKQKNVSSGEEEDDVRFRERERRVVKIESEMERE